MKKSIDKKQINLTPAISQASTQRLQPLSCAHQSGHASHSTPSRLVHPPLFVLFFYFFLIFFSPCAPHFHLIVQLYVNQRAPPSRRTPVPTPASTSHNSHRR